jgi:hypothetical protein
MVCSLVKTSIFILFVATLNDRCLQIVELNLFYVVVFHFIVRLIPPVTFYFLLIFAIDSNEYRLERNAIVFDISQTHKYRYKMDYKGNNHVVYIDLQRIQTHRKITLININ